MPRQNTNNYFLDCQDRPANSVLFNHVKTMFSVKVLKTKFSEGRKTEITKIIMNSCALHCFERVEMYTFSRFASSTFSFKSLKNQGFQPVLRSCEWFLFGS